MVLYGLYQHASISLVKMSLAHCCGSREVSPHISVESCQVVVAKFSRTRPSETYYFLMLCLPLKLYKKSIYLYSGKYCNMFLCLTTVKRLLGTKFSLYFTTMCYQWSVINAVICDIKRCIIVCYQYVYNSIQIALLLSY